MVPDGASKATGQGCYLGAVVLFLLTSACHTATAASEPTSTPGAGVPIRVTLERPSYLTAVIDDRAGNRVRTLISGVRLPAGENTLWWDGCDEGRRDASGSLVRRRVDRGTYRVHGLVHDGIVLRMNSRSTIRAPLRGRHPTARAAGWPITRRRATSWSFRAELDRLRERPRGPAYWSARALARRAMSLSGWMAMVDGFSASTPVSGAA